ncbi:MAG: hypothetical protein M1820_005404 [Bogoriella megaspora]|nr:MAG: hypothetical protein M1820_005404 [Bogoriella megaspora]
MADPATSAVFSGINTTFKLAKFCLDLKDVSEENRTFCSLINRVRKDRAEAMRERRETSELLQAFPHKRVWIDDTIEDIDEVLYKIGSLIEGARVDGQVGRSVSLQHRFEWVLRGRQEFLVKQAWLSTCHQSLLSAIDAMHSMKVNAGEHFAARDAWQDRKSLESDDEPLKPPNPRRKKNKSGSFITYTPAQSPTFSDEYDKALSARQSEDQASIRSGSAKSRTQSSLESPSPALLARGIPSPDNAWDDIDPKVMLQTAAQAIEKCGAGSKSTNAVAASLRNSKEADQHSGTQGRRRRLAARFADND